MSFPLRGFILQPTYRRGEGGRAVVHLYGRLEDGRSFLVRDRRLTPHFFILSADAERARAQGARNIVPTNKTTLVGRPLARVEVEAPADAPPLRERLKRSGIVCYEADIRFAMRYLIERGIRGALSIAGE